MMHVDELCKFLTDQTTQWPSNNEKTRTKVKLFYNQSINQNHQNVLNISSVIAVGQSVNVCTEQPVDIASNNDITLYLWILYYCSLTVLHVLTLHTLHTV